MADKHIHRCSAVLVREMQIKIAVRYHFTPIRMAVTKKTPPNQNQKTASIDKDEKLEPHTLGGNVKWCSCYGMALLWSRITV